MKIHAFAAHLVQTILVLGIESSKVKNFNIITDEKLHDHQNLKHGEIYACILREATEKYDCYEPFPLNEKVEEQLEQCDDLDIYFEYHSTDCSETVELLDDDSEFKMEYEFESLEKLNEFKIKLESFFEDILPPGPGVGVDAKYGKEFLGKGIIIVYLPIYEKQDGLGVGKVKEIVDKFYESWSLNKSFERDEHLADGSQANTNVENPQKEQQKDIELADAPKMQKDDTVGKQAREEITTQYKTPSKMKQNDLKEEPIAVVKRAVKLGQKQKTKNDLPEHSKEKIIRNSEEKNSENEEFLMVVLIGMGVLALVVFTVKYFCA